MRKGMNIYTSTNYFYAMLLEYYINKETSEIIDDFDYNKLPQQEKDKCIPFPTYDVKSQLKIAEQYFNEERNNKYKKILFEHYTTSFIDEINDATEIHCMLEGYGIRDDFLDYEEKKQQELLTEFCKKNHIKYYYEYITPEYITPEIIQEKIMNMLKRPDWSNEKKKYYDKKIKRQTKENLRINSLQGR